MAPTGCCQVQYISTGSGSKTLVYYCCNCGEGPFNEEGYATCIYCEHVLGGEYYSPESFSTSSTWTAKKQSESQNKTKKSLIARARALGLRFGLTPALTPEIERGQKTAKIENIKGNLESGLAQKTPSESFQPLSQLDEQDVEESISLLQGLTLGLDPTEPASRNTPDELLNQAAGSLTKAIENTSGVSALSGFCQGLTPPETDWPRSQPQSTERTPGSLEDRLDSSRNLSSHLSGGFGRDMDMRTPFHATENSECQWYNAGKSVLRASSLSRRESEESEILSGNGKAIDAEDTAACHDRKTCDEDLDPCDCDSEKGQVAVYSSGGFVSIWPYIRLFQKKETLLKPTDGRKFACVLAKLDPHRFQKCRRKGFGNAAHAKGHLTCRQHLHTRQFPIHYSYCFRCQICFEGESDSRHADDPACQELTHRGVLTIESVKSHSGRNARGNEVRQWYDLWGKILPDIPPPKSPFTDEDDEARERAISRTLGRLEDWSTGTTPLTPTREMAQQLVDVFDQELGPELTRFVVENNEAVSDPSYQGTSSGSTANLSSTNEASYSNAPSLSSEPMGPPSDARREDDSAARANLDHPDTGSSAKEKGAGCQDLVNARAARSGSSTGSERNNNPAVDNAGRGPVLEVGSMNLGCSNGHFGPNLASDANRNCSDAPEAGREVERSELAEFINNPDSFETFALPCLPWQQLRIQSRRFWWSISRDDLDHVNGFLAKNNSPPLSVGFIPPATYFSADELADFVQDPRAKKYRLPIYPWQIMTLIGQAHSWFFNKTDLVAAMQDLASDPGPDNNLGDYGGMGSQNFPFGEFLFRGNNNFSDMVLEDLGNAGVAAGNERLRHKNLQEMDTTDSNNDNSEAPHIAVDPGTGRGDCDDRLSLDERCTISNPFNDPVLDTYTF
ncbi:hypothetical protein GQ53DRAFT_817130 [Thozetella sp. PMI_491]|nr:hypothetical protein GQ53DRAFT_817130 [Thozetella sp. PMI_491]